MLGCGTLLRTKANASNPEPANMGRLKLERALIMSSMMNSCTIILPVKLN